jgi:hypothetical protein
MYNIGLYIIHTYIHICSEEKVKRKEDKKGKTNTTGTGRRYMSAPRSVPQVSQLDTYKS